ncbi:hypothetical protein PROAA_2730002 [Candidatus Propionivibrio aalborgensis]|uniref:Uncharacterized protein n=1 Tax=Candidatus Propionivibrio aalborgensis TaxID=1860101 RepID=A0A1A8XWM2_9RHOO|nr:hypothetical protein PROAA_2730002 [Candidatus Propionivibrio aalborgensis]
MDFLSSFTLMLQGAFSKIDDIPRMSMCATNQWELSDMPRANKGPQ